MLDKLVWKILKGEKTIWNEFIQAKYLKGGNLLQVTPKNGDSALWKGIIKVTNKLQPYFRWKIGNGQTIRFWFDNWLSTELLCTQVTSVDHRDSLVSLNQVLNNMGEWDFSVLKTEVPQCLRDLVMEANVVFIEENDQLLWNETASGVYSCQSAYQVLRRSIPGSSYNQFDWNVVWKSKLTNKMKHFMWLAVQDRLSTNMLRFMRKITDSAACTQCNGGDETVLHIFRHCSRAKEVWKVVLSQEDLSKFETIPDGLWMMHNLKKSFKSNLNLDVSWLAVFTTTIWLLWKSRNAAIFRGAPNSKNQIIFLVKQLSSNLQVKLDPNGEYVRRQKWTKPLEAWKKLNTDGSVRPDTNQGAIGYVLRDDKGEWVWGYAAPIQQPTVNESEILSVLHGLQRSWEQIVAKIQVELDSNTVYKWIMREENPPRELEAHVQSCKRLLRKPWAIRVKKIDRKANSCADHLARLGYNCEDGGRLWLSPPIYVIPILGTDMGV